MELLDLSFTWSVQPLYEKCNLHRAYYDLCRQMGLEVDCYPSMGWLRGVFDSLDLMYYTTEGDEEVSLEQVVSTPCIPPHTKTYDTMYYTSQRHYTVRLRIKQPCHLSVEDLSVCLKDILMTRLLTIVYRPLIEPHAIVKVHLVTIHDVLSKESIRNKEPLFMTL
jgi:hypothetical protein